MVHTRARSTMDSGVLEHMTTDQLRQEASKYGLSSSGRKTELIEAIISHLERYGPAGDFYVQETGGPLTVQGNEAAASTDSPNPATVMYQVVDALQGMIRRQEEEKEERRKCFEEQQAKMMQLLEILAKRTTDVAAALDPPLRQLIGPSMASSSPARSTPSLEGDRRPRTKGWTSGNAVQALASQISEFSGSEDNNVRSWVRRVEKIAQVHSAPEGAMLLAASSKLTGSARKWFDFQSTVSR